MRLSGYDFEHVANICPLRSGDNSVRRFMPQERYKNERPLPLNKYSAGPFCKFSISYHLRFSGVYLISTNEEVRYVGECANLSARFNAGYGNISPKNCFKGVKKPIAG